MVGGRTGGLRFDADVAEHILHAHTEYMRLCEEYRAAEEAGRG